MWPSVRSQWRRFWKWSKSKNNTFQINLDDYCSLSSVYQLRSDGRMPVGRCSARRDGQSKRNARKHLWPPREQQPRFRRSRHLLHKWTPPVQLARQGVPDCRQLIPCTSHWRFGLPSLWETAPRGTGCRARRTRWQPQTQRFWDPERRGCQHAARTAGLPPSRSRWASLPCYSPSLPRCWGSHAGLSNPPRLDRPTQWDHCSSTPAEGGSSYVLNRPDRICVGGSTTEGALENPFHLPPATGCHLRPSAPEEIACSIRRQGINKTLKTFNPGIDQIKAKLGVKSIWHGPDAGERKHPTHSATKSTLSNGKVDELFDFQFIKTTQQKKRIQCVWWGWYTTYFPCSSHETVNKAKADMLWFWKRGIEFQLLLGLRTLYRQVSSTFKLRGGTVCTERTRETKTG